MTSLFGGGAAPATQSLFGQPASGGGLFGAAAPSGGLFGAAPASSASLFGAPIAGSVFGAAPASGGLFGAPASSSSLFGGGATGGGLFGQAAPSSSGLFGAATPAAGGLFGQAAPASGGLFGAASPATGGLFGQAAPATGGLFGSATPASGGLFGAASSPSLFGGGGGLFGASAPASTPSLFGGPAAPAAGGLAPQALQQGQQQLIIGKNQQPVGRKTTFENLPDHLQQAIRGIEEKVRRHRNDAAALKSGMLMHESLAKHKEINAEAKQLAETLQQVKAWLEGDAAAADSFKEKVIQVVRGTEQVAFLLRVNKARRDFYGQQSQASAASGQQPQPAQTAIDSELLNALTSLPSPYLKVALAAFGQQLQLLRDMLASLESLVPPDGPMPQSKALQGSQLPEVLRNMHEYFIHVAACVARLDARLGAVRAAYLSARQAQGDYFDPFADADARAAALSARMVAEPKLSTTAGGGAWTGAATHAPATAAAAFSGQDAGASVFGAPQAGNPLGGSPSSGMFGAASGSALNLEGAGGGDSQRGARGRSKRSK